MHCGFGGAGRRLSMDSYGWLHDTLPRYLWSTAAKTELRLPDEDIFQLALAAGICGSADVLLSSDENGSVRVWSVCPSAGVVCIWQSSGIQAHQLLMRSCIVQVPHGVACAEACFAVSSDRQVSLLSANEAISTSGIGALQARPIYTVDNPFEGTQSLQFDSTGSFLAICSKVGCLRVYHDKGKECTLVQTHQHERKAVFCPGDPTMLFCISNLAGHRLINLRACSECSAFCSAVDKQYGRLRGLSEEDQPGMHEQAWRRWSHDPITSSWLPPSPLQEPAAAQRPTSTSCAEPHSSTQQHSTRLSPAQCRSPHAPASSSAHNHSRQQDQQLGPSSACTSSQARHAHRPAAYVQPAVSTIAATAGLDPQASPANTVQTPVGSMSACTEAQQTYSRRRRPDSSTGRQANQRSKAAPDFGWLQGAENMPATESQHVRQGLLWWNGNSTDHSNEGHSSYEGCHAASAINSAASVLHRETLVRYSCSASGDACFDAQTGRFQYPFQGHTEALTHVLPLQDGQHVLTSSADGTHKLWTVEGKGLCTFRAPVKGWHGCMPALSTCERFLVAAHGERTFAWQIKGVLATAGRLPDDGHGNHCTVFDDHKCPVTALAISACNSMMASADASGRIVVRFSLQQP